MNTDRRRFIQTVGAGAAGCGLVVGLPANAAPPSQSDVVKAVDTFPPRVVGPGRKKLMWPIKNELKSKRIKHDAPIDPISWAYMKELRENNKTKTIYPVNPYVEVYQFRDSLYGWFTHNLDGGGDVWMFLVVGPERALLIDTAYGLGDLPGLAAEITGGKPLLVANTHEHFDHAYGNCRFEKVYCHEYLVPYLETQNEHIWDYLFDEYGDNIWVEFDRNDLPRFKKYEIVGVADGYKFDLGGGHEVELMYQGGHSAGHAAYIDKRNRIVFTGDNVICDTSGCGSVNVTRPGPHSENQMLKAYAGNLKRLIDRGDEYDYVYPAHFMVDVEKTVLPSQLATIDAILADPETCDWRSESYAKGGALVVGRYARHIPRFSVVFYGYKKA
jgi:glyoxylase-like metal-dependent hydrolase (beta-lactamase superfamily II)